jgi:hypothetical protein
MFNTISSLVDSKQFPTPAREARRNDATNKAVEGAKVAEEQSPTAEIGSQKFLNQQILKALNEHLSDSGAGPIDKLNADDFTPEKVADRILSFIGGVIGGLRSIDAPDDEVSSMMQAARDGVEQGFGEARDILDGLGVYDGKVAEDADKTYQLLQDGLDRIEKGDTGAGPMGSVEAYESVAYSDTRNLSMEVRTQDGDLVTIRLDQQDAFSQSRYAAADEESLLFVSEQRSASRYSLAYSVEGELDEGEQEALKQLLKDVDDIADSFYSGSGAEAFEKAMQLGYNEDELASYSLSMSQSQTLQATSAYRAVSQMNEQPAEASDALFKPFAGMAGGLRDMFNNAANAPLLDLLQTPDEALSGMLGQRIEGDERFPGSFGQMGEQGLNSLRSFLDSLVSGAHRSLA